MSRNVSATARAAINAQQTGEAFLILLTISHPNIDPPIRVTSDGVNTISRGETFIAYPFEVTLPDDRDDQVVRASLRVDNVGREIATALRSIDSPPQVTLEVVLGSSPDTVEAGPFDFTLRGATYDALTVTGDLVFEDILNEPIPGDAMTPANFPGLFV